MAIATASHAVYPLPEGLAPNDFNAFRAHVEANGMPTDDLTVWHNFSTGWAEYDATDLISSGGWAGFTVDSFSSYAVTGVPEPSTLVLVYRALTEWGETASPPGRRAIGILLFQDVALVPLILLVPLLANREHGLGTWAYLLLALNSVLFVATVPVLRKVFARWAVPLLSNLRSAELVILFGLIVLVGFCLGAKTAGLSPALGAFAGGLVLNGNRLTGQIDALILPYRESFGVVFFVSLGTLFDVRVLVESPVLLCMALLAVLALKTGAATVALRVTSVPWHVAAGVGLGSGAVGRIVVRTSL